MKRILCISMVLMILLTAYSAPIQQPHPSDQWSGDGTYGVYRLTFKVKRLSGWPFERWDFVYRYNDKEIQNGHQIYFSLELFAFHSIQVDVVERDNPSNSFSAVFPVAICDGGSGETEITVTNSNGRTAIFKITCQVKRIGKR